MANSFHTVMTNYQGLKQALHVNTGQNNLLPPAGDSHHALQALLYRLQVRLMIYPLSSRSLCKSLRALKEALSRGAFRYHLIPCNPSQKHPAGYSGCYTTTLTAGTHCFSCFFVSLEETFQVTVAHEGRSCFKTARRRFFTGITGIS